MGQAMPETAMIALIVEDEPLVRMIAAEMVEEAGLPRSQQAMPNRRSPCWMPLIGSMFCSQILIWLAI